jgi:cytochrome P450
MAPPVNTDVSASGVRLPLVEPDNLEARVSALESQVRKLADRVGASEHDAVAARVIAGAADRDVTAILGEVREFRRATVGTFNALREDFSDLRTDVDRGFTEMRGKLDATAAGQERIAELIKDLIANRRDNGPPRHP